VACEEAGNYELAEKVAKGNIPVHYVQDDGTLDPAAVNPSDNSVLPKSHPVIRTFTEITSCLNA